MLLLHLSVLMDYKTQLLPEKLLSCLNIFAIFILRKTDEFKLWEMEFSSDLFPQQHLAAFSALKFLVWNLPFFKSQGLQRPCSRDGYKKWGKWCLEGATAGTGSSATIPSTGSICTKLSWEAGQDFAATPFETSRGTTGYTALCYKRQPYGVI